MPADTLTQVRDMAAAGGVVFAVVAPGTVGCAALTRRLGRQVIPSWQHRCAPWTGFDILFLFFWQQALTAIALKALDATGALRFLFGPDLAAESAKTAATLGAMTLALPALLATAWAIRVLVHDRPWTPAIGDLPGRVTLGAAVWAVVTPLVFVVNFVSIEAARWAGLEPDRHPLSRMGVGAELIDRVAFGVVVCLVTPIAEEFVFRGLMVQWAMSRRYRPWVLMVAAGAFAVTSVGEDASYAPVGFVAVLATGLALVGRVTRAGRTASAVYASATVFAAAHSAVWPTPVPLFVLGLALGYVAARTGGIAACVTLHGLFNAVSFVYLLRGGA